ncbi:hypothetical protein D1872_342420 [compost metagenome]
MCIPLLVNFIYYETALPFTLTFPPATADRRARNLTNPTTSKDQTSPLVVVCVPITKSAKRTP